MTFQFDENLESYETVGDWRFVRRFTFIRLRTWCFRFIRHFEAATLFLSRRILLLSSSSIESCTNGQELYTNMVQRERQCTTTLQRYNTLLIEHTGLPARHLTETFL